MDLSGASTPSGGTEVKSLLFLPSLPTHTGVSPWQQVSQSNFPSVYFDLQQNAKEINSVWGKGGGGCL